MKLMLLLLVLLLLLVMLMLHQISPIEGHLLVFSTQVLFFLRYFGAVEHFTVRLFFPFLPEGFRR